MSIKTTNRNVVANWSINKAAHSNNKQLTTDGQDIYSYRKLIGITLRDGTKVALEYRSTKGGSYISQTTSTHVGQASGSADLCMTPDAAKEAGLIEEV
jgi:hypothetical protein